MKNELSLIEIESTIEKFELVINGIMNSSWESGINHIIALYDFLNRDRVIKYIVELTEKNIKDDIPDVNNWLGTVKHIVGGNTINFQLPENIPNRIILINKYIYEIKINYDMIDKVLYTYSNDSIEINWNKFVNDFFYRFYIDIKCLLIDLKTDALHNNQKVSEKTIINYIFDSNVQNINSENMENNEFKQN